MSACVLINDLFKDSFINCEEQGNRGEGVDWMHLAQVTYQEHSNEFSGSIKDGEILD
jgi:hypothetical protein